MKIVSDLMQLRFFLEMRELSNWFLKAIIVFICKKMNFGTIIHFSCTIHVLSQERILLWRVFYVINIFKYILTLLHISFF